MSDPRPHRSGKMKVEPQWIDFNGHLNMAFYSVLFDRGADQLFALFGFGPDYVTARNHTTFSAEFHVCYLRELKEGDTVHVESQLIGHDEKRFHFFQTLYHEDGWAAATGESLGLHIDLSGPKVVAMPQEAQDRMALMLEEHSRLPRPANLGRQMGIPSKA